MGIRVRNKRRIAGLLVGIMVLSQTGVLELSQQVEANEIISLAQVEEGSLIYDQELWQIRGTNDINEEFYAAVKPYIGGKDLIDLTVEDFKGIEHLDLSGKEITEIPKVIELFTDLKTINLSNNKLYYIQEDLSPYLLTLENIDLSENYIWSVDEEVVLKFGEDSVEGNLLPYENQYRIALNPTLNIRAQDFLKRENKEIELKELLMDRGLVYQHNGEYRSKSIPSDFGVKSMSFGRDDVDVLKSIGLSQQDLKHVIENESSIIGAIQLIPPSPVEINKVSVVEEELPILKDKSRKITAKQRTTSQALVLEEEDFPTILPIFPDEEDFPTILPIFPDEEDLPTILPIFPDKDTYIKTKLVIYTNSLNVDRSKLKHLLTEPMIFATRDSLPPQIWEITPSQTTWTNKPITVTVSAQDFGEGSDGTLYYSFNGGAFSTNKTFVVSSNQRVSVRVKDRAGNVAEASIDVSNIDTSKPGVPTVKLTIDGTNTTYVPSSQWSSQTVKAMATNRTSAMGGVGQSPIKRLLMKDSSGNIYFEDSVDVKTIKESNGNMSFAYEDEAGNISDWTSPVFIKVDSQKPKVTNVTRDNVGQNGGFMPKSNTARIVGVAETISGIQAYSFDDGKTWTSEKINTTNKTVTWKVRVKSNAGVISDAFTLNSGSIDGVKPIVTGITKNPAGWTNKNVIVRPTGDPTGSSFKGYWLNGVKKDDWGNGEMEYTENMDNQNFAAFDFGFNYADNVIPFSITNIDKINPYIQSVQTRSIGNGQVEVTIVGADDLSGLDTSKPYRINGGSWGTNNKVTVPMNATIKVEVQDKATNVNSFDVEIKNGSNQGVAPVLTTDRSFSKWGNKNHSITMVGGTHLAGTDSLWYKIRTKRNANGDTVNSTGGWIKYTGPFTFSQEGEFEIIPAVKGKDGTFVEGKAYGVWIDKTPPVAPALNRLYASGPQNGQVYNGERTKYAVKFIPTNWYQADKLSGVQYMGPRIEAGSMGSATTSPTWQTFTNVGGANSMKYHDFAGNMSATTISHNNDSRAPDMSYTISNSNMTSGNIELVVSANDPYYWGMHALPYKVNGNPDDYDNGWVAATEPGKFRYTITENGVYTIYSRDSVNNVSSIKVTISNIDKTPPVINSVAKSPTSYTNGDVTVTVAAKDDAHEDKMMYSFDGGSSWQSSNKFVAETNQTLKVAVKDTMGRITHYGSNVVINNIDRDMPTIASIDKTDIANGKVRLSFDIADVGVSGLASNPIRYNDGPWVNTRVFDVEYGVVVKVQVKDNAGNIMETGVLAKPDGSIGSPPIVESEDIDSEEWTNRTIKVTVNGGRIISGISHHEYAIAKNGGSFGSYQRYNPSTGIVIDTDGVYQIKGRAVGRDGTFSQESPIFTVKRDSKGPSLSYTATPALNTYAQQYQLKFKANDELIGLADTFISIDNKGTWSNKLDYLIQDNTSFVVYAKDKLGNMSNPINIDVSKIDRVAPNFQLVATGGVTSWSNQPVVVSVRNVEDRDTSGKITSNNMHAEAYNWGSGWSSSTEKTITVPTNIVVSVRDKVGNSSQKTLNIPMVDIEKPETPVIRGDVPSSSWTNHSVGLIFSKGNNTLSGLKHYMISINNSAFTKMTGSLKEFQDEGVYSVRVKAMNNAGTLSDETNPYIIKIDKTAPSAPVLKTSGKHFEKQTFSLVEAGDNLSGIDRLEYSIGGGNWIQYSGEVTLTSEQQQQKNLIIKARAIDHAGNVSDEVSQVINVVMIDVSVPLSLKVELKQGEEDVSPVFNILNRGTPIEVEAMSAEIMNSATTLVSPTKFKDWNNIGQNDTRKYIAFGLKKVGGSTVFKDNWFVGNKGFAIGELRQGENVSLKAIFKHGNAIDRNLTHQIEMVIKVTSVY